MTDKTNLASKLADLKLIQNILIECAQKLMTATDDDTIRERLSKIVESDRENLSYIDKAIEAIWRTSRTPRHYPKTRGQNRSNDGWFGTNRIRQIFPVGTVKASADYDRIGNP